jgi:type I restriction enzyme S subunit
MKALSAGEQKIAGEEKRKAPLQALFKTMLHHLMSGKIRVRDS